MKPLAPSLAVIMLAASLAGCSSTETVEAGQQAPAVDGAEDRPQLETPRLFDDDAQSDMGDHLWEEFYDFQEAAESADLVFVGRVAGFTEGYATDKDKEDPTGPAIINDGIVFEVLEVLSGDSKPDTVTVAHPAILQAEDAVDGPVDILVEVEPIEYLRTTQRASEKPAYVVFVWEREFSDGLTTFMFGGPGSIATVDLETGNVDLTGHPPFANVGAINRDGGLSLSSIREWITNGPPSFEVPREDQPTSDLKPDD